MNRSLFFIVFCSLLNVDFAFSSIAYYSVKNYRSHIDNPFLGNSNIGTTYLEDFETQFGTGSNVLTTPYATGWNGGATGGESWGVQEDYSSAPGSDGWGWAWSDSIGRSDWMKTPSGLHFDFTPDELGRYPEYVGAALRGYGILDSNSEFNVILVYDSVGNEVTQGGWMIPKPAWNPDQPLEELFLNFEGIYVPGGISRIQFRDFTNVDHLTYGYAPLPEPGTISLAGLAAAGLLLGLRSRR